MCAAEIRYKIPDREDVDTAAIVTVCGEGLGVLADRHGRLDSARFDSGLRFCGWPTCGVRCPDRNGWPGDVVVSGRHAGFRARGRTGSEDRELRGIYCYGDLQPLVVLWHFLLAAGRIETARRPRYGGTLRRGDRSGGDIARSGG